MKIKTDCKYAMIVPTSMGVRISPSNGQPCSRQICFLCRLPAPRQMLQALFVLGLPVKVLTKFVQGSPIADFIKSDLRSRGMDFEGREIPQGGPWGYRHQFNIADSGFGGPRPPRA